MSNHRSNSAGEHRPPITLATAAQYMGVSRRWLQRQIAEKRIPYIKARRRILFRPQDLDAYLAHNYVPAVEE